MAVVSLFLSLMACFFHLTSHLSLSLSLSLSAHFYGTYDRVNLFAVFSCRRNRQKEVPAPRSRDFHVRRESLSLSLVLSLSPQGSSIYSVQCRISARGKLGESVKRLSVCLAVYFVFLNKFTRRNTRLISKGSIASCLIKYYMRDKK